MSVGREGLDYLEDIQTAMRKIGAFIEGATAASFRDDEKTVYAVIHAIEVVGEAASRLIPDLEPVMLRVIESEKARAS
jgi:uncharacterized protein with HEPN domain